MIPSLAIFIKKYDQRQTVLMMSKGLNGKKLHIPVHINIINYSKILHIGRLQTKNGIKNGLNKANIRANFTGGQYGATNEITFDVISDVACEANIHIFFHPKGNDRGFNDDTWYSLVKGTNSYSWSCTYENARWFVLFANSQGGGALTYKVNQIKYKGRIYDVNTALNTYVPTEADYDFGKQMDSLKTLNTELYHLFVEPISEDE